MTEGLCRYPCRRVLTVLAWLWLAVALPFLTDAGCNMFIGLGLAASWAVLAIIWLILLRVGWRAGRGWWLSSWVAGGPGLVLAFTDLGLIGAGCPERVIAYRVRC